MARKRFIDQVAAHVSLPVEVGRALGSLEAASHITLHEFRKAIGMDGHRHVDSRIGSISNPVVVDGVHPFKALDALQASAGHPHRGKSCICR
ncbi:MAG: hypothetical protein BMS9Abin12_2128 [Acidimicrobiia bacterium]|nr:MAG: hypothetical protein BMS9Abin12_2128 [Acidimicrobiia bacterium]